MTVLARGLASLGAANVIEKAMGVVKLLAVSRIIGPAELGLYGLALVVIVTIEQLSQVGVESALIEKGTVTYADKSSAWVLLLARGVIVGAAAWIAAPAFATFFNEPELTELVRLMAFAAFVSGLQSVEYLLARRELRFGPWFWVRSLGSIVDLGVSLLLALQWGTASGLVVGYVASVLARTALTYIVAPYSPSLRASRASLVHLLRFGRWAGGLSIVLFLLTQGDDLVVGKMLGVTALGFYQMGYRISNLPTSEVTHVFSGFTMPFYARLKNSGQPVAEAYLAVFALTALIAVPMAVTVLAYARPFVATFLGPEWFPAIPIIQLLAVWGVTRSLDATSGALFFALGRPDLDFKLHLAKLGVLGLIIVPAATLGDVHGVAIAVVVSGLVVIPFTVVAAGRLLGRPVRGFARLLRMPLFVGSLLGITAVAVNIGELGNYQALAVGALALAVTGTILGWRVWQGRHGDTAYIAQALWAKP